MSGFYEDRCLVLAHRGALLSAPENTLPAFKHALMQGADGVELDVTLTADDVVVVIHDERLERTTSGRGPVREHTLAEIKTLDAGRWFDPAFVDTRVPMLDEVLAELPATARLNVELKPDFRPGPDSLPARALAVVRNHGAQDRVLFSSFSPWSLEAALAAGAPHEHLALLRTNSPQVMQLLGWWGERVAPFAAVHPWRGMLTPKLLKRYQTYGWKINPWFATGDEETMADARHLVELGARAIITNHPRETAAALTAEQTGDA